MDNSDRESLARLGYQGFLTWTELRSGGVSNVPRVPGTYVVIRESDELPLFLERSPAGWFKQRDPTVQIEVLTQRWNSASKLLYVGKADNLQKRLRLYMRFGAGKAVAHHGGRLIWQLTDSALLVVGWRECRMGELPLDIESILLNDYERTHGRLPFANLRR